MPIPMVVTVMNALMPNHSRLKVYKRNQVASSASASSQDQQPAKPTSRPKSASPSSSRRTGPYSRPYAKHSPTHGLRNNFNFTSHRK